MIKIASFFYRDRPSFYQ